MADSRRFGLDEVVAYFQEIGGPAIGDQSQESSGFGGGDRVDRGAGRGLGAEAIAQWAAIKREILASVLPLPLGIPCKGVFRRVLMALRPEAFQMCFAAWARSLRDQATAETGVERG